MNKEKFVDDIIGTVYDSAIESTLETIEDPSLYRKKPIRQEVADWHKNLSKEDRGYVKYVISRAVHLALFNVFCVLDGSECIDEDHGRFELNYILNEQLTRLNDDSGPDLHDIFNARLRANRGDL